MIDVTIVMPAYNVEKYIAASIESVLAQTINNWELIIVNDGSTDNTKNIIEEFVVKDSRIILLNQENQGVSSARNRGIAAARGEYISFLDSDDLYEKEYIEMMSLPLREDQADMTFCKFQELDGSKILQESPKDVNQLYESDFIEHLLHIKNGNHSMGTMYKLNIIKNKNITFGAYSYGEDLAFLLTMSCYSRVAFIPEYLYKYIFRGGSLSRREIPYADLLGELNSLYSLTKLVKELGLPTAKSYEKYIERRERGTLNNIRRYYWGLIKQKKYELLDASLNQYQRVYGKQFDIKYLGLKKITNGYKLGIIKSHSTLIWKIGANLPF